MPYFSDTSASLWLTKLLLWLQAVIAWMPTLQEVVQKTGQFHSVVESRMEGRSKSITCKFTSEPMHACTYVHCQQIRPSAKLTCPTVFILHFDSRLQQAAELYKAELYNILSWLPNLSSETVSIATNSTQSHASDQVCMKGISKRPETEGHTCNYMNRVTFETLYMYIHILKYPCINARPFC